MEVVEEEENFSNFGKFKGKVGSKIFRFFFDFRVFPYERVRRRGIRKFFVFSKISRFSIKVGSNLDPSKVTFYEVS